MIGFGANGGFDFTKELKEMLRKKKGFGANGGFDGTKEKRELIVKNYEKQVRIHDVSVANVGQGH